MDERGDEVVPNVTHFSGYRPHLCLYSEISRRSSVASRGPVGREKLVGELGIACRGLFGLNPKS